MIDKKSNRKKPLGIFIIVCGLITLVISAVFLVMSLMGVEAVQEDGGILQYITSIAIGLFLTYYGRSLMKNAE